MELIEGRVPKILIIDDAQINVALLKEMVEQMGYQVVTAINVEEVNARLEDDLPDLILLDIIMPELDGYEFCEILKGNPITENIPVIFVSSLNEKKDMEQAYAAGGVEFIERPIDINHLEMIINTQIKIYGRIKKLEHDNHKLIRVVSLQAKHFEKEQRKLLSVIARLAEEEQGIEIRKHQDQVAQSARLLAQALNFTEQYENKISDTFTDGVEIAASIHDIGKIALPQEILLKPYRLTEEEKKIVNTHTTIGYDILKEVYGNFEEGSFVQIAADIIRSHHENWDGSGYPDGLKGEEIPLAARIIRIVDCFDSMQRTRCYRPAYSRQVAIESLKNDNGKRFDPFLLAVFLKIIKQI